MRHAVVGTPAYFKRNRAASSPEDLKDHRCINYRMTESGPVQKWHFERKGKKFDLAVNGPLVVNDDDIALRIVLSDAGLGLFFEASVSKLVEAGSLVWVLQDWCPTFPGFKLYYPSRRQISPAFAAFVAEVRATEPEA